MAHADSLWLLRSGKQILNPLVRPNIPAGATETAFYRKFRHKARGRPGRVLAMRAWGAPNTDGSNPQASGTRSTPRTHQANRRTTRLTSSISAGSPRCDLLIAKIYRE